MSRAVYKTTMDIVVVLYSELCVFIHQYKRKSMNMKLHCLTFCLKSERVGSELIK